MSSAFRRGFTLIEILLALAIIGVLMVVAVPSYGRYVERTRVAQATVDIVTISAKIKAHVNDNRDFPDTLAQVGEGSRVDPWGRPYHYLVLRTPSDRGRARKNRNLVPINSDFDLYSAGKDGRTTAPLRAKDSQDDVVRANDGAFVGLASTYSQ
jgi:general secretion pathway protein G